MVSNFDLLCFDVDTLIFKMFSFLFFMLKIHFYWTICYVESLYMNCGEMKSLLHSVFQKQNISHIQSTVVLWRKFPL